MILFRYLNKEVFQTSFSVILVLLLIVSSGRLAKYLSQSSTGDLSSSVVFQVILYRIPDFLPLIIPLGFFIGIILTMGRLYSDNEMVIINNSGLSKLKILNFIFVPSFLLSILVAYFMLFAAPASLQKVQKILQQSSTDMSYNFIAPGRFQTYTDGKKISYVGSHDKKKNILNDILLVDYDNSGRLVLVKANYAKLYQEDVLSSKNLLLFDGRIYQGIIDNLDYRITTFQEHSSLLHASKSDEKIKLAVDSKSTASLLRSDSFVDIAALHWRLSFPLVVLVVSVFALGISKTNKRLGKYTKLLPAILIYIVYIMCITAIRVSIENNTISPLLLWISHFIFFCIAVFILFKDEFRFYFYSYFNSDWSK